MNISSSPPVNLLCFVVALACLAGCATVNTVERAEPVAQKQMVDDKRVLTDAGLDRRVRVVGVNESTGPGGFLKVQVEVLNTTRSLQDFNYKFEWFDSKGNLVSTAAFLPRQIEGKESLFLTATAPAANAKDFRLKLIED
jgi:uncharacterized protein YcfL